MTSRPEHRDQKALQVVLDTNILFGNWLLLGPSFDALEKLIRLGVCALFLPQVVVQEAENCFKEEVDKLANQLEKFNRSHGKEQLSVDVPNVEAISGSYPEALKSRLGELNATLIPYEDIPHEVIMARAISARRPFRESGKGYRDTLLWEGVLEIARSNLQTLLVTGDVKDFHGKDGGLHEDLVTDLEARGLPSASVQIFQSLPQLVRDFISPLLERSSQEAIQSLRDNGSFKSFTVLEWFRDERDAIIDHLNREAVVIVSDGQLENPEVTYIGDPLQIEVEEVYALEDDTVLIQSRVLADVTLDVFVFKGDLYLMEDLYPLEVQEFDWNDHYAWAKLNLCLPLDVSLTFNVPGEKVEGFEIEAGETFGWCRKCGAAYLSDSAESCYRCEED